MTRRAFLAGFGGLAAACLLGGCGSVIANLEQPPDLYQLTPKSSFGDDLLPVDWTLVIDQPNSTAAINNTRIALMQSLIQVQYYANSNWTDRAPAMVQGLIVESFENSGLIPSVGRQAAGLRSDFVLLPELREFQAEYFNGTPPVAHVRINVKLIKMPDRKIVANASFEQSIQATADSIDPIVEAFDDALGKVLKKLVRWTLVTGSTFV